MVPELLKEFPLQYVEAILKGSILATES